MFDIGWTELLVIGVVALIVVGPKDLPGMFRTLGRFTGKMRGMAREFSRAMEDAADQAGVKDVAKDLRDVTNPKKMGLDGLEKAAKSFEDWSPSDTLSEERREAAKKIHDASAKAALDRQAKEAAEATADAPAEPVEPAAAPADDAPKDKT